MIIRSVEVVPQHGRFDVSARGQYLWDEDFSAHALPDFHKPSLDILGHLKCVLNEKLSLNKLLLFERTFA